MVEMLAYFYRHAHNHTSLFHLISCSRGSVEAVLSYSSLWLLLLVFFFVSFILVFFLRLRTSVGWVNSALLVQHDMTAIRIFHNSHSHHYLINVKCQRMQPSSYAFIYILHQSHSSYIKINLMMMYYNDITQVISALS